MVSRWEKFDAWGRALCPPGFRMGRPLLGAQSGPLREPIESRVNVHDRKPAPQGSSCRQTVLADYSKSAGTGRPQSFATLRQTSASVTGFWT